MSNKDDVCGYEYIIDACIGAEYGYEGEIWTVPFLEAKPSEMEKPDIYCILCNSALMKCI